MPETKVMVEMDLTENGIVSDSTPSSTNNSPFADISKINEKHDSYSPFMTLEHNICVLDGSLDVFDSENLDLSYFSSTLSDDNCIANDKIAIDFSSSHSIAGIGFDFGTDSFLDKVTLTYFYENKILDANDFYPDNQKYTEKYGCEGFNKIEIEFDTTKFPRMFTRLQSIEYGFKYSWQGENIISCQINEEVNPISSKVPINTCSITIYDQSNEFNILNPEGVYKYLQTKQKFNIYGIINDTQKQLGVYFLDTWDGNKPYEITFNLISPLGILDRTTYFEGGIIGYNEQNMTAYDCLSNVLNDAGLKSDTDYTVSNDLKNTTVLGLLPICSHKEAIQNVAFTANACIDDTRDGIIKIYKQNQDIRFTLEPNILFDNVNINKNEIVTGLDITLYKYDLNFSESDYREVFNGYIDKNQTVRVTVQEPIFNVRYKRNGDTNFTYYSGYTDGKFYFDFAGGLSGTYLIQVQPFKVITTVYSKRSNVLPNHKENILKIDKATLLYDDGNYFGNEGITGNVLTFANNLMNFYEYNTLKVEFEYLSDCEILSGQRGSIFTEFNQYLIGSMLSQRINAGSGFLTSGVMIANNSNLTDYYFGVDGTDNGTSTGQYELYSNDNFLM
ncbi:hypothetical protein M9Y10_013514 [Tritrichomonas musculus]|uniref:Uncharacterized protein n=1 Tax=Tritrichomonas musculus TaxID=1915356 RepID=A0ABR2GN25_9EUKA